MHAITQIMAALGLHLSFGSSCIYFQFNFFSCIYICCFSYISISIIHIFIIVAFHFGLFYKLKYCIHTVLLLCFLLLLFRHLNLPCQLSDHNKCLCYKPVTLQSVQCADSGFLGKRRELGFQCQQPLPSVLKFINVLHMYIEFLILFYMFVGSVGQQNEQKEICFKVLFNNYSIAADHLLGDSVSSSTEEG